MFFNGPSKRQESSLTADYAGRLIYTPYLLLLQPLQISSCTNDYLYSDGPVLPIGRITCGQLDIHLYHSLS